MCKPYTIDSGAFWQTEEMPEIQMALPPGVQASWGLIQPSGRGRRPSIQLADILSAAVALADTEGLAGVSMPRVAHRVGVTQNALYRHVASKEELLVLIADSATGEPPHLEGDVGWRTAAHNWATAVTARYLAHPWLLEVRLQAPMTRNTILWTEAFLRATRDSGLPVEQRVRCALLLDGHARHTIALRRDLAGQEPTYSRALVTNLVPLFEQHGCTEFAAFLRHTALQPEPPDTNAEDDFRFGLELILDGISALTSQQPNRKS
jgi:AcrR family transcriptional regulator